ncbi:MAG: hypothetical protein ABIF88_00240 [archaeon]
MAIKTPDILPGEKGYIPRKEKTALRKQKEKFYNKKQKKLENAIGKIKLGSNGFRLGKPTTIPSGEKKYILWRYAKRIGEIRVKNKGTAEEKITMKYHRLGGIGNFKHLIQDADFQLKWVIREQELLLTQSECKLCHRKISKTAKPNLYHLKMWKKRAELLEKAENIPNDVIAGKITVEEGWNKFSDTLEEGNRYYMSLKDTALICPNCAKQKGLNN